MSAGPRRSALGCLDPGLRSFMWREPGAQSRKPGAKRQLSHAAGRNDLAVHPVLEPLGAPPVHRCHLLPAYQHGEMEMIAAGEPRHPAPAKLGALFDGVADLDTD